MISAPMKRTALSAILLLATAMLHAVGIAVGRGLGVRFRGLARAAGAACAVVGVGLVFGAL